MEWYFSSSSAVLLLFACTIIGLVRFQNYPERVFGVLLLILVASGIVTGQQVIKSFSNQGVLTLILLMVCSLALEKTKLLRVAATFIVRPSYASSWFRLFSFSALSSALLNNTAVVSTLLAPIRNNPYHSGSRLLLPLSYAAIFGGTLTLIGTSTNLIVNSMAINAHLPALGFFDFTLIGGMVVLVCGIALVFFSRWLPQHKKHQVVAADYFIDAKVQPGSSLIGKTIEANGLRNLESLFLVEILREGRLISPVTPFEIIEENDRLIFSGDIKKITLLAQFDGLNSYAHKNGLPLNNLKEVIIRPDSVLIGKKLKLSGFRALFDSAVIGIRRDGEKLSGKLGDIVLKAGDYLIIAVGDDFKSRRNINKNFYRVSDVEADQCLNGWREHLSVYGFFVAILLAAVGCVPLFTSLLIFLGALLLCGCLSSNEIMHRLPKNIWLIVSSALVLSEALTNTGALNGLKQWVSYHQADFSPLLGIIVIYVLTWILTELVTNNAAAALIFPLSISMAESLHTSPKAYLLALAFGASASFISPYGYQTNLMVYSAGNYRLKDFMKIGLPISIIYGTVVVGMLGYFYL
ncbi:SLC13 family permease [Vibrio sp. CAIM 722]|uniref:SLC13 family permease n=1 Tax=Vibrio eleionomae TaxID=2653505 RepID=A0A7X4LPZ1_9VIBR|nr:SLC13 family permease [Vibrio eleionomae]MZI96058.1 SLC13 family permease [Vibrio eleionomae]